MSFYGRAFTFDSTPCELYDLMMYDINNQDEDIKLGGDMEIVEETVGGHWRPYFYGTRPANKLEFDMVFGVNQRRIDQRKYLDRFEIAEIATWLCGHQEYKWLFVDQPDARVFGYRCMISQPTITQYGSVPWALQVHVICDSPYAYLERKIQQMPCEEVTELTIYNESSLNGWYYPKVVFEREYGTEFSITNSEDDDNGPAFTDIPGEVTEITIDNEHGIIENNAGSNLYAGFNFKFLRLKRGYNYLTITGTGTLSIECEYPINVGG